jgi:hypothetical protein
VDLSGQLYILHVLQWHDAIDFVICLCLAGKSLVLGVYLPIRRISYGSTDLRLYTSTKLKIVIYWLYSLMHKKTKFIFK